MVAVTSHAKRRLKERCGVSKNSAMDMAERAFNKGISFENASTDLKKYISSVYIRHEKIGDNIRIYGSMVYIFDNRTLITVYPIPENLLNEMERIATSIDDAADKAYLKYNTLQNRYVVPKKVISKFDTTVQARKSFSEIGGLRRKARKQGLFILNSPNHITGGYMIVDENNVIQTGELCGLSCEEVERYLEK